MGARFMEKAFRVECFLLSSGVVILVLAFVLVFSAFV
jgi:hypothetical protein